MKSEGHEMNQQTNAPPGDVLSKLADLRKSGVLSEAEFRTARKHLMPERIVRKREANHLTGISDSTRWRLEQQNLFPRRLRLGGNAVGYRLSELQQWIASRNSSD